MESAAYGFQTTVIDDAIGYAHWGPTDTDYIGVLGHLMSSRQVLAGATHRLH